MAAFTTLSVNFRSLSAKLIALGAVFTFVVLGYIFTIGTSTTITLPEFPFFTETRVRSTCTPEAYARGSWEYRPRTNKTAMTNKDEALEFAGFQGCASSREYYWHLAADNEEQWDRFPDAFNYEWVPSDECSVRDFKPEELLKDLVEKGGWLLIGDSITEGHFASISCLLYPHVIATPDYNKNPYFDRAWPQNMYLNPDSPLVQRMKLPRGFNATGTPLVTFRRVDTLLTGDELTDLHRTLYNPPDDFKLISDEAFWALSPEEYVRMFTDPANHYGTMVISTAGHWTTTLFSGYRDEAAVDAGYGIEGVVEFFGHAMGKWAADVQRLLDEAPDKRMRRQVVVRAYLPGHEDCHDHRKPWTEVQPFKWNWYNWANIGQFNRVFERVLSSPQFHDIHYLGIDNPARLRPDAHVSSDCLHIMGGAGVLEGWTHYIWHYVTREVNARIR
ncbi:hypothetical protein BD626DRAFT_625468 [Schizophyllum amplum]|uniref:Uncharacterized protein n=1 Tax=Schizophyllum amplum TaxID=97359 RepID=A0A550CZM8_9AGAR|nr:hypothetical protein BD626DRAFT_625468 [Auriculariopsis ampla]